MKQAWGFLLLFFFFYQRLCILMQLYETFQHQNNTAVSLSGYFMIYLSFVVFIPSLHSAINHNYKIMDGKAMKAGSR